MAVSYARQYPPITVYLRSILIALERTSRGVKGVTSSAIIQVNNRVQTLERGIMIIEVSGELLAEVSGGASGEV
jgi:hypothetical protein